MDWLRCLLRGRHQLAWLQASPDPAGTYTTGCARCGCSIREAPSEERERAAFIGDQVRRCLPIATWSERDDILLQRRYSRPLDRYRSTC